MNKKIVLSLLSIILALFIVELILCLMDYSYVPLKIVTIKKTLDKYDWRHHFIFDNKDFVYDPYLMWRPKNNFVFNSEGHRGRLLSSKRGLKTYCIFTFGDSNTLGLSGKDVGSWPGYLDEIMERSGRDCLVINFGVWGYTSFQGLRQFKEALRLKPDMVMVSYGSNDASMVVTPDKKYVSDRFGIGARVYKYRIGLFFISLLDRIFAQKITALVPRVSIQDYEKNLEEFVELCNNNIKIILLTRPFIGSMPEDRLHWKNFIISYNDVVKKVSKEKNIKLIDLYQYFKNKEEYFCDESHFTEDGHKAAAGLIYEEIKTYLPMIN